VPYLVSKWVVHGVILLAQCTLLVVLTKWLLGLEASPLMTIPICFVAGMVGVGIGLLVSTLAQSEVTAIVSVPLILIPFIMFGGLVAPYDQSGTAARALINLMPSRWAYEALIHAEALENKFTFDSEAYDEWIKDKKNEEIGKEGKEAYKEEKEVQLYKIREFAREPFWHLMEDNRGKEYRGSQYDRFATSPGNSQTKTNRQMFYLKTPPLPPAEFVGSKEKVKGYRTKRIGICLGLLMMFSTASGASAYIGMRRRLIK
jgi:hypothetical protein